MNDFTQEELKEILLAMQSRSHDGHLISIFGHDWVFFIKDLKNKIDAMIGKEELPSPIIKCLDSQFTLTHESCGLDIQDRVLLRLVWNVSIWIDSPVNDWQIALARREAMTQLNRVIYGEIMGELLELRYLIRYGDQNKAE